MHTNVWELLFSKTASPWHGSCLMLKGKFKMIPRPQPSRKYLQDDERNKEIGIQPVRTRGRKHTVSDVLVQEGQPIPEWPDKVSVFPVSSLGEQPVMQHRAGTFKATMDRRFEAIPSILKGSHSMLRVVRSHSIFWSRGVGSGVLPRMEERDEDCKGRINKTRWQASYGGHRKEKGHWCPEILSQGKWEHTKATNRLGDTERLREDNDFDVGQDELKRM